MTPQQEWVHVSEHHYEDGLVILSMEQLKMSFLHLSFILIRLFMNGLVF